MPSFNPLWALTLAGLGFLLGIAGRWPILWIEGLFHRIRERNMLKGELEDLVRHYNANLGILASMRSELEKSEGAAQRRLPSTIHFEKLKVPGDASILTTRTSERLPRKLDRVLYHLRLRIRNRNLEADRVVELLKSGSIDRAALLEHIDYLQKTNELVRDTITTCIPMLSEPPAGRVIIPENTVKSTILLETVPEPRKGE